MREAVDINTEQEEEEGEGVRCGGGAGVPLSVTPARLGQVVTPVLSFTDAPHVRQPEHTKLSL